MNAMTIALDAMGGDYGAQVVVPAALRALQSHENLKLILVGDQQQLRHLLQQQKAQESDRLVIHHTTQMVAMDELPSQALRKKDTSMRVAINLVKEQLAHACVSAGNTGALMATARFVLRTLPGIDRPAIMGTLPNRFGAVHVLDLGANIDCTADHLFQFAIMAQTAVSATSDIEKPRVGLLNVGAEEIKGNEVVKTAAQKLQEHTEINYLGYVEGDDIFMGQVDIIVCDGFVGNVALKTSEGSARLMKYYLKQMFTQSVWGKLVALLAMPLFRVFARQIDPARYNGASFLGLRGIVVKSHGGASVSGFARAIEEAVLQVQKNVPQRISRQLATFLQTDTDTHDTDPNQNINL